MPLVSIAPATVADAGALIALHLASRALHAPWVAPFVDQAGFDAWFAGAQERLVAREAASGERRAARFAAFSTSARSSWAIFAPPIWAFTAWRVSAGGG
jgi:hypothetical protein